MNNTNRFNLVDELQKPEFYSHSVQLPIQVIQTHISWVFLTGDYAYKLKKTVDFGFLDFSTLEKRKYFLNQELEMNRLLAPDIYLEVLPIALSGDHLVLNGSGQPIEYVLKMRQFPQESIFINLFKQGKLTANNLRELAKVVAEFHGKTRTDEYVISFGSIDKIKESIDENYQITKPYIGIVQTLKKYQETQQFTDLFLIEKKGIFESRKNQGKIKECHGDLHLKNICLWKNKIQLFDRIEFNEEFRFVDVMYDIAFTVMDLDVRGRKDLSNIFLNSYLEQTGDWEGLQVLPLYLSRQAYVRAKVTSMLLDDPNISSEEKQEASQTARDYYHLAWEYTKQSSGCMILMSGLSGSGKTTVAQYLAPKINAIHIRSDAVRKHLAQISLTETGSENLYTPQMNEKTYNYLLDLGIMLSIEGFQVILDAKFDRLYWREKALTIGKNHQLPVYIIHCQAPLEILSDRLSERQGDISDATPNLLQQQQETADPLTDTEQTYVKTLDTTKDWQQELDFWLDSKQDLLGNRS